MAGAYRRKYTDAAEYNVIYSNMRGVDFSGDGSTVSRNRFAYLENMYRDYDGDGDGITESIPGFRKITETHSKINGIFSHKDSAGHEHIVVHSGEQILRFPLAEIDTLGTLEPIGTAKNVKSRAFSFGDSLYILDGESIHRIDADGIFSTIGKSGNIGCHVPLTYVNGTEYTQRNLLTRDFYEQFRIGSSDSYAKASRGLRYVITDEEEAKCKVCGIEPSHVGSLFIPSVAKIGNKTYTVYEIADRAFYNHSGITEVYISEGCARLGKFAFAKCVNMKKVILPDSVYEIDNACFDTCELLDTMHLGLSLSRFGISAFSMCGKLLSLSYAGSEADFKKIENTEVLGNTEVLYQVINREITVSIPVFSPALNIKRVLMGTDDVEYTARLTDGLISSVDVYFEDKSVAEGKCFEIYGTLSSDLSDYSAHGGFLSSSFAKGGNPMDIITGCTVAESFDGRIFLAGNPSYPNAIFYSSRLDSESSNLHFGDMNYFCDGIGAFNTVALLSAGGALAVFKEGDDGCGSIYYHVPKDTGVDLVPKIYPAEYIHSGICALGEAISFFDDPVFISAHGISALSKKAINLERSIATRSGNVNPRLLCEELSRAAMTVWRGYLFITVGGRAYLADSRATFNDGSEFEYEWYYLDGIGTYIGQRKLYRYSPTGYPGFPANVEMAHQPTQKTVHRRATEWGVIDYVIENGYTVPVYVTEEYTGGSFSPACALLTVGERLLFGTECGDVCVFNNDKRGVAPESLSKDADFNPEEYKRLFGRQIHPSFYTFDNRAVRYGLRTALDDGGIPHLLKSSVKHSLAIKCRSYTTSELTCEVGTDKSGYREICKIPATSLSFADLDFSSPSLSTSESATILISEKERGWVEKQISVYSFKHCSPIGIFSISYRFKVKGRIKNR